MDIRARRVFRLSLTTALALTVAYALGFTFAFIAPLFAFLLTFKPGPPIGSRNLLAILLTVAITTSVGLLLVPLLMYFPLTAILVVILGIYLSFYLTVHMQQQALGAFVAIGFTLISAAGLYDFVLGQQLVESLVSGVFIAILCQWLIYPLFPEDPGTIVATPSPAAQEDAIDTRWIAIRGTLIVLPVYLLALNNPSLFVSAIMKSVSLVKQSSHLDAARAGRELLGSTFLGGVLAALFWLALSILPNLWMYTLWMLLFGLFVASKIYGVLPSRYPDSFWQNVLITMLILLGPAVMDIGTVEDVYMASFERMSLFVFVTLYTWWTVLLLDALRHRRQVRSTPETTS